MSGRTMMAIVTAVLYERYTGHRLLETPQAVAIDELPLRRRQLGRWLRKAMGQLRSLREQLEDHTRLFGTTATLTNSKDQLDGRSHVRRLWPQQPIQTSVYMSIYAWLPTDNPTDIFKKILYTAS